MKNIYKKYKSDTFKVQVIKIYEWELLCLRN